MIHKVKGEFVAECNECGTEIAGGTVEDFKAFMAYLRKEEWVTRKEDDEYIHLCPSCSEIDT